MCRGDKKVKKSKILVAIGLIIILTAIIVNKPNELNVKIKFYSSKSLIESFDKSLLLVRNDDFKMVNTQILNDCISERKRLSGSAISFNKIDLEKNIKLSSSEKNKMINKYKESAKTIYNTNLPKEIIPFRFKAIGISNVYSYENGINKIVGVDKTPIVLDVIIIKENGSYVFDYFLVSSNENGEVIK